MTDRRPTPAARLRVLIARHQLRAAITAQDIGRELFWTGESRKATRSEARGLRAIQRVRF